MKVTISLVDVPAFTARYGLSTVRTGRIVDGLPECQWEQEPGQTQQQAALVAAELKDGMRWTGVIHPAK